MSEIKENSNKKTSLTGTAAHLQQELLLVKEQSCGQNGYEKVVGSSQVNKISDHPTGKHVYGKNSLDSQVGLPQEAAGP